MKRSEKVKLNPNIEFRRLVLFTISPDGNVLEATARVYAQEDWTKIISSCLLILPLVEEKIDI